MHLDAADLSGAPVDALLHSPASDAPPVAERTVASRETSTRRGSLSSRTRDWSKVAELWHAAVPDGPDGDQDRTDREGAGRRPEERSWRAERPDAK
jgi:hypothetical protein